MASVSIDQESCKGCELCVRACSKDVLRISETFINHKGYHPAEICDPDGCVGCKACALTCPDVCITVMKDDK